MAVRPETVWIVRTGVLCTPQLSTSRATTAGNCAAGGDDPVARLLDPRREVRAERLPDVVDVARRLIDDVVTGGTPIPRELLEVRQGR
jgi:hypothetical protein